MQLFYTEQIDGEQKIIHLPEEEIHHLAVLRKRVGDAIQVIDGKGNWYETTILTLEKRHVTLQIHQIIPQTKPKFELHLAIAPPKNIERMEWLLEKTTEIGIDVITPLQCERSERTVLKNERLEKILISACKQSLRATRPTLHPLTKFKDFLVRLDHTNQQRYIAHCENSPKTTLLHNYKAGNNVLILIGPEGDFSPKEILLAEEQGCLSLSLGKARLRTETAGIVVCQTIQLLNEWEK
ncbi:MAG: 16S rRNA (uracil(1498)-N(3))-methyltransferase [Saprospiraceae bacterium]|nr:16S rRNA (uracil(1498)-N(3))-methyltransferase [Saprospiraceae bacterium]